MVVRARPAEGLGPAARVGEEDQRRPVREGLQAELERRVEAVRERGDAAGEGGTGVARGSAANLAPQPAAFLQAGECVRR